MFDTGIFDENFFVALAFITVIGFFVYLRLPRRLMQTLDDRARAIEAELQQARDLRVQAEKILADYELQRKQAEKQAKEIIALARETTRRHGEEQRVAMQAQMERRTKQAEEKIARAEEKLLKEVHAMVTALAVDAAAQLVVESLSDAKAKSLIDENIADLTTLLQ